MPLLPNAAAARAFHARLAFVAGAVAILWALTGFLHPLMSWTAPRPAVQTPPPNLVDAAGLAAPGPMLDGAGAARADLVRLAGVLGTRVWLVRDDRTLLAVNAETGARDPALLARHAEKLARYYAGGIDAPVAAIRIVDAFSLEYPSVNRYLPVVRVAFADPSRLALYVDPMTDRLAAVTDGRRRAFLFVFQNVHTLSFLKAAEPLRKLLLLGLMGTAVATAFAGAVMLMRPGARKGLRAIHRWAAVAALPLVLMFGATGLFHLFAGHAPAPPAPAAFAAALLQAPPPAGPAERLTASPGAGADLGPVWRLASAERGARYVSAAGAGLALDDAARARALAGAPADAGVSPIFTYTDEYGFAMKRLPVLRVETPRGARFIDADEGRVAGLAKSGLARAEAWSFDRLHKFALLDGLGVRRRDYVSMASAALIIFVAGAGLWLAARRRRKKEMPDRTRAT